MELCSTVFFFKQKTAYEMLISDWSSDVCSSDLEAVAVRSAVREGVDHSFQQRPLRAFRRWIAEIARQSAHGSSLPARDAAWRRTTHPGLRHQHTGHVSPSCWLNRLM